MFIKANKLLLRGDHHQSPGPGYIHIEGSIIVAIHRGPNPPHHWHLLDGSQGEEETVSADIVCPGFVDIHTHGIGGATELLEYWLHDYTFKKLPAYGCTSVLATITYPKDFTVTQQAVEILKKRVDVVQTGQAVLAGIHAEGPIISDCGGLPHSHASSMTLDDFKQLLQEMGTALKVMTISPSAEAKCGYARLQALLDHGAVPAFGHDKSASEADILGALRVCAAHSPPVHPHITHLFNVSSFNHRLPSLVNFGMVNRFPNDDQYQGLSPPTAEIVGDMVHVAPLTISAVLGNRSPQHVAFITDAVMDADCPSILYAGNKMSIQTISQSKRAVVLHGTSTIAGSCTNMFQIFRSLVDTLRVPVDEAVQMLSLTPATIAKVNQNIGSIQVGKRADILLLDSNLDLQSTIIAGKVVFSR